MVAILTFAGGILGGVCYQHLTAVPPYVAAIGVSACVALAVGGIAAGVLNRLLLGHYRQMSAELQALRQGVAASQDVAKRLAAQTELQRRLRHDLRGALSPALLTTDRLINHEDPKVRRAGEIMVKSVDRASFLLADPEEAASPPADP